MHIEGTANVIAAAKRAGVRMVIMLSFLRARPDCGSPYHESKWAAEDLVRDSGLDYTILKAGMIYGRGDHLINHLSHTVQTLPVFADSKLRYFRSWSFARRSTTRSTDRDPRSRQEPQSHLRRRGQLTRAMCLRISATRRGPLISAARRAGLA
ncbi:hypothetical protein GCM10023152_36600 [Agromyces bauzanensis]|uniref:NAD(P)-binding domain-containing protein n=1 Tax=Agromyces bauzanensis TaxID=1308924 RepID=A0A917UT41_9MICO|nr:hypothetical protein GCM10011372_21840 [Agromyces bauzanensis]